MYIWHASQVVSAQCCFLDQWEQIESAFLGKLSLSMGISKEFLNIFPQTFLVICPHCLLSMISSDFLADLLEQQMTLHCHALGHNLIVSEAGIQCIIYLICSQIPEALSKVD